MNSLASNDVTISSTGGLKQDSITTDSVLIAYSDLRKVNSKLVELEYEKEINKNLKDIISNDSIAINNLNLRIDMLGKDCDRRTRTIKKQRNVATGVSISAIILLILSIL